jgi:hypothetical protein
VTPRGRGALPPIAGAALSLLLAAASAAGADLLTPGETPIADVLQLFVFEREVVAVDGMAGTELRRRLDVGETVHFAESHGRVGVVLTDRRVLAVAVRSGDWQESRYRRGEPRPESAFVGERVALVVTSKRAVGFDGGSGNLVERSLGPREQVLAADASGAVGVVVTDRRALGISPFAGGFFERKLRIEETIEAVAATGNVGTVRTSRRILSFQAATGAWVEVPLPD